MEYDLASVDYILQTTRSVRKRLDFDREVDRDVVMECLDIALQAPTGSNSQSWRWLIVTDADKKAKIGEYYKTSYEDYDKRRQASSDAPKTTQAQKVRDSASYLSERMGEVPMMIFPCVQGRPENATVSGQAGLYGSILPATWSLMLALRARGIGAAWTTLHLYYEKECAEILGIPDDITVAALLPVAYFTGDTFQIAKRKPAKALTYWDKWDNTQA
jgi:nitroreductase